MEPYKAQHLASSSEKRITGALTTTGLQFGNSTGIVLQATSHLSNVLVIPSVYIKEKAGFELWKEIASNDALVSVDALTRPVGELSDPGGLKIFFLDGTRIYVVNQFKEKIEVQTPPPDAIMWKYLEFLNPKSPASLISSLALDLEKSNLIPLAGKSLRIFLQGKSASEKLTVLENIAAGKMDIKNGIMHFEESFPEVEENTVVILSKLTLQQGLKASLAHRVSSLHKLLHDCTALAKTILGQKIPTSSSISTIALSEACLDPSITSRNEFKVASIGNCKLAYLGDAVLTREVSKRCFRKGDSPKTYQAFRSAYTDKSKLARLFDHIFTTQKVILTWDFFYNTEVYTMRQKAEFIEAILGLFEIKENKSSIDHLVQILFEADF